MRLFYYISFFLFFLVFHLNGQDKTIGLVKYDSSSYEAYTLFSPMTFTNSYLIDNCGQKIKEWTFDSPPGLMSYLTKEGNIVRAGRVISEFGAGGAGGKIEIKNWDDELIWSFLYADEFVKQHHDFEVLPNGNILILAWDRRTKEEAIAVGRNPASLNDDGLWFEKIIEVKPIGLDSAEIIWEWFIYDHLNQSFNSSLDNFADIGSDPGRLNVNYNNFNPFNPSQPGTRDWLHMNSIDYHEGLDHILLSCRNANEVYIIDHSTNTLEAAGALGGQSNKGGRILFRWGNNAVFNKGNEDDQILFNQHDASWVDPTNVNDLRISIFNNGSSVNGFAISSLEVIEPVFNGTSYSINTDGIYEITNNRMVLMDNDSLNFSSPRLSSFQVLDNGHFFVTSGNFGTFKEIVDGEIIWEYINPITPSGAAPQGVAINSNDVFRAQKYSPDFEGFESKTLTPSGPLELNDDDSLCESSDTTTSVTNNFISNLKIYPNPTTDFLYLEGDIDNNTKITITDISGFVHFQIQNFDNRPLDIQNLGSGIYFINLSSQSENKSLKFVKL